MKYVKTWESYTITHTDKKNDSDNFYFETDNFEYRISISKYVDDYYSIGFKAKKSDDYFFNHELITNENPYEVMDTVVKVAKNFYLNKINELEEMNKNYNLNLNPKDFIKGFVFSFSGNEMKNLQRLNLYKRYFTKINTDIEFFNKGNIYYLKIK